MIGRSPVRAVRVTPCLLRQPSAVAKSYGTLRGAAPCHDNIALRRPLCTLKCIERPLARSGRGIVSLQGVIKMWSGSNFAPSQRCRNSEVEQVQMHTYVRSASAQRDWAAGVQMRNSGCKPPTADQPNTMRRTMSGNPTRGIVPLALFHPGALVKL